MGVIVMPKIYETGVYREMTAEELAELEPATPDALTEMVTAMSTATTIAQMRSAAKSFLEKANSIGDLPKIADELKTISNYKDAAHLIDDCYKKIKV